MSLLTRKMQIKTKMRNLAHPPEGLKLKIYTWNVGTQCRATKSLIHCWLGVQKGTKRYNPLEKVLKVSYKISRAITLWHSNSISRYLHKRNENISTKKTCIRMFTRAKIFLIVKNWKQPRWSSTGKWVVRHIHTTDYNPATQSNTLPVYSTTWINLKIILSEVLSKGLFYMIPLYETKK